jgi:hypothetical protein
MAITNHESVGKALELLKAGLASFIDRELRNVYGSKAQSQAELMMGNDRLLASKPFAEWDAAALFKLMWDGWNEVETRRNAEGEPLGYGHSSRPFFC